MRKCINCQKDLEKKQARYCSQECHFKHRTVLAREKQHYCTVCSKKVDKQISKHWVCRKCKREIDRLYYHKRYKDKRKLQTAKYYKANREKMLARQKVNGKLRNIRLRKEALEHYGGKCKCCGEKRIEFLAFDHIKGGGNKHRKQRGVKGQFYSWLKKNNYPDGFRILCHNCNQSRGFYGYCPHQKKK